VGVLAVILCPALANDLNASWPSNVAAGATGTGNCNDGFAGTPTRLCKLDGTWAPETSNDGCIRTWGVALRTDAVWGVLWTDARPSTSAQKSSARPTLRKTRTGRRRRLAAPQ
jgi:hypothetical protein